MSESQDKEHHEDIKKNYTAFIFSINGTFIVGYINTESASPACNRTFDECRSSRFFVLRHDNPKQLSRRFFLKTDLEMGLASLGRSRVYSLC